MHSHHNPITRLISILHRRAHIYFGRHLRPYGLNFTHFRTLVFLHRHDGMRQEDIRSDTDADKGAVAHSVRHLVEAGLVSRMRDETDRRAYVIGLTPAGVSFLEEFGRVARGFNDAIVEGFSAEELEIAEKLLQRMVDNTCELVDDECGGAGR